MDGVGPPLVTPFTRDGSLDEDALRSLVGWVEARGVDFLVPCGSNSEAPLMAPAERERVVEVVCDAASVPVLAATGYAGSAQTRAATAHAANAGADAALVVTPYYYPHDQDSLADYYRELADVADLPVYLYSVPAYTGVRLEPETVSGLAGHPNVAGIKDSSGDLEAFQRIERTTADASFAPLIGAGGVLASALDLGATGGVLALANVAPGACAEVYDRHRAGDAVAARERNRALVELNRAVTTRYGVPGLKAAMRERGAPAGTARRPHQPVGTSVQRELAGLLADAGVTD